VRKKIQIGFTLIELLVVISILAILITLGLTSFASAQKKSRDAKRKADLRDYKNALEQYYSVCGMVYPTPASDSYEPIICWSPTTIGMLDPLPYDPRSGDPYLCPTPVTDNCNEFGYVLCAQLESESPSEYCVYSSQ